MNVLVVGSGGREHALCWKLSQNRSLGKLYCAPGNGGTSEVAQNVPIDSMDNDALVQFAEENDIGLTIVGPEAPLVNGIVDRFEENDLRIFGPRRFAALLEGSKAFAKQIMEEYGIPTARVALFNNGNEAIKFIKKNDWARVIKADGLAAGKAVYVCQSESEAITAVREVMVERRFGDAGDSILIEERLIGEEASFLVFTDGKTIKPLISSQDHKLAYDDDKGPNTGGMGAYAPAPVITPDIKDFVIQHVMEPVIRALSNKGTPYKGVLYAGLMITDDGPRVLEFNCRFGDPEAQPILTLLESDLLEILNACVDGTLADTPVEFANYSSCCVVMASGGYPGKYETEKRIYGLTEAKALKNLVVFHSGTEKRDGGLYTRGGRVLGITAKGNTISMAIETAYRGVSMINFEKHYYRHDIGHYVFKRNYSVAR